MQRLVVNEEHHEARELLQQQPHKHQQHETSYSDFLVTHTHVFDEAMDLLDVDSWLRMIDAMIGLLRCSKMQKALFMAQ
jgi:hypothetical protein